MRSASAQLADEAGAGGRIGVDLDHGHHASERPVEADRQQELDDLAVADRAAQALEEAVVDARTAHHDVRELDDETLRLTQGARIARLERRDLAVADTHRSADRYVL